MIFYGEKVLSPLVEEGENEKESLEAHLLLQILVNPEADVGGIFVPDAHIEFSVVAFDPGLGEVIRGFDRPPELPVLFNDIQIGLFGVLPSSSTVVAAFIAS